jgi:excisionase family DNA binding protein
MSERPAGEPLPEILTIEQAAELIGVSVKTFNKVLHSQSIPGRKIGREWKFSRRALIEWVGSGRSDQFYREGSARNGEIPAQPPAGGGRDEQESARRTSGWRVKLD